LNTQHAHQRREVCSLAEHVHEPCPFTLAADGGCVEEVSLAVGRPRRVRSAHAFREEVSSYRKSRIRSMSSCGMEAPVDMVVVREQAACTRVQLWDP
jgi:hypothetical protein